jgi:hypothetical protein
MKVIKYIKKKSELASKISIVNLFSRNAFSPPFNYSIGLGFVR